MTMLTRRSLFSLLGSAAGSLAMAPLVKALEASPAFQETAACCTGQPFVPPPESAISIPLAILPEEALLKGPRYKVAFDRIIPIEGDMEVYDDFDGKMYVPTAEEIRNGWPTTTPGPTTPSPVDDCNYCYGTSTYTTTASPQEVLRRQYRAELAGLLLGLLTKDAATVAETSEPIDKLLRSYCQDHAIELLAKVPGPELIKVFNISSARVSIDVDDFRNPNQVWKFIWELDTLCQSVANMIGLSQTLDCVWPARPQSVLPGTYIRREAFMLEVFVYGEMFRYESSTTSA